MSTPPDSQPPHRGENPFEDSEAQLDSIMGDMANVEPLIDPGETRRLPPDHHRKQAFSEARNHGGESTFIDDLQAVHQAPMYAPGTLINERFQLVKQLGAGGMGAVYLANDLRLNDQKALKMMLPALLSSKEAQNRFILEIKALQRLAHPGIVRVFDYGRDSRTGSCFFSMEYVEGTTLSDLLKRRGGRLTVEETVDIVHQLLEVLTYAHNDLVHRDLKPLNIMLRPNGRILVLDFGLAKMMSPGQLTQSSMVLGTVYYQSPEQSIRPGEVDKRSDLYSVGVIMYQLLTGEVPVGHIHPPSKLNKAVTRPLDAVIMRCLESQREDRYQTAGELAEALRRALRPRRLGWTVPTLLLMILVLAAGLIARPDLRLRLQESWTSLASLTAAQDPVAPEESDNVVAIVPPEAPVPDTAREDIKQLLENTRTTLHDFESDDSLRPWYGEAPSTLKSTWETADAQWSQGDLAGAQTSLDTIATQLDSERSAAIALRDQWETPLRIARESAEAAQDRLQALETDGTPTEESLAARERMAEAETLLAKGQWAEAESQFRSVASDFDSLIADVEAAQTMALLKAALARRDESVSALQKKARDAQAIQYATARYEGAMENLLAARNAAARADGVAAEDYYTQAEAAFELAYQEARAALDAASRAAREALARREATMNKQQEPVPTSASTPIIDETETKPAPSPGTGLTVSPERVELRSLDDTAIVRIYHDGEPAAQGQIEGYRFADHDRVAPMFAIDGLKNPPGAIRITPNAERIEPGDYTLNIVGGGHTARLPLRFRLAPAPTTGTNVTGTNVTERINISIPDNYTTGQYIRIPLTGKPGREFRWTRNGTVVQEGKDKSALEIIAEKAGKFELSVSEFANGQLKASWTGSYTVKDEAPVRFDTKRGSAVNFSSAEGFGAFRTIEWTLDGVSRANTPVFTHVFEETGNYELICHGTDPAPGESMAFRKLIYRINVN